MQGNSVCCFVCNVEKNITYDALITVIITFSSCYLQIITFKLYCNRSVSSVLLKSALLIKCNLNNTNTELENLNMAFEIVNQQITDRI